METFIPIRQLVPNPTFREQRTRALAGLESARIDEPMAGLIDRFAKLPYCFTLQSCYGHFLFSGQPDRVNTERLPSPARDEYVEYRIAYVALCVDNCDEGKSLLVELQRLSLIDPDYIQSGCATWFWQRQVNSYASQVEPERFKTRDSVRVDYREALHLQHVRDEWHQKLLEILDLRVQKL